MSSTLKTKLALAAVVAAGAVALPSAASAAVWNSPVPANINGAGQLTLTVGTNTTTCDVTVTSGTINNTGSPLVGTGSITGFTLTNCVTSIPGCTVTAVANNLPWAVTTSGSPFRVTISGIKFTNTYAGASCPLTGVPVSAAGSLTADWTNPGLATFTAASGLTVTPPLGTATVDGEVELTRVGGGAITLS